MPRKARRPFRAASCRRSRLCILPGGKGRRPSRPSREGSLVHCAERLAESRRLFNLLAYHAADVIFVTDAEQVFTYVTPALEQITGRPPSDVVGKSVASLVHERWHPLLKESRRVREEEESRGTGDSSPATWQLELVRKDGSLVWIEAVVSPLRDASGRLEGFLGVARDISARKRMENALAQARRDMGALLSAITAILVLVDRRDCVTHINESACEALGLSEGEAMGKPLWNLPLRLGEEALQGVAQGVARCREHSATQRLDDMRFERGQGEGLLGLTCYPVEGGGVLLFGRDITEARMLELRQAQEQKMESIGRLAAGLAHEINTPVQYLGFNAGFLEDAFRDIAGLVREYGELRSRLEQGEEPETLARLARRIADLERQVDLEYVLGEAPLAIANSRQGVEQIAHIVQAMRQLSHPGQLARANMGLVDINAMIANAVVVSRNEWKRHAVVEQRLEPGLPLAPGWGPELGQVVLNLLLNAAQSVEDAMAERFPTAEDSPRPLGAILVQTRLLSGDGDEGDRVEIVVADDGCGVPEELRSRIFEPFFTTKDVGRGSGQGLAIAHAIVVEQHGGSMSVEESPQGGALFRILLPAASPADGE